jgi:hypothetical protein
VLCGKDVVEGWERGKGKGVARESCSCAVSVEDSEIEGYWDMVLDTFDGYEISYVRTGICIRKREVGIEIFG